MFKIELDPQPVLEKYPYSKNLCRFSQSSLICCYFVGNYTEISWQGGGERGGAPFYFHFLFFSVQKYTVLLA